MWRVAIRVTHSCCDVRESTGRRTKGELGCLPGQSIVHPQRCTQTYRQGGCPKTSLVHEELRNHADRATRAGWDNCIQQFVSRSFVLAPGARPSIPRNGVNEDRGRLVCSSSATPRGGAKGRRSKRAILTRGDVPRRTHLLGEDGDRPAAHEVLLGVLAKGDRPQAEAKLVQELRAAVSSLRGTNKESGTEERTGISNPAAEGQGGRAEGNQARFTPRDTPVFFSRLWRRHRSARRWRRINTRGRRDTRAKTPRGVRKTGGLSQAGRGQEQATCRQAPAQTHTRGWKTRHLSQTSTQRRPGRNTCHDRWREGSACRNKHGAAPRRTCIRIILVR